MKKVVSLAIAAVMTAVLAVSLAACNNTPANTDTDGTTAPVEVNTESGMVAA